MNHRQKRAEPQQHLIDISDRRGGCNHFHDHLEIGINRLINGVRGLVDKAPDQQNIRSDVVHA